MYDLLFHLQCFNSDDDRLRGYVPGEPLGDGAGLSGGHDGAIVSRDLYREAGQYVCSSKQGKNLNTAFREESRY